MKLKKERPSRPGKTKGKVHSVGFSQHFVVFPHKSFWFTTLSCLARKHARKNNVCVYGNAMTNLSS